MNEQIKAIPIRHSSTEGKQAGALTITKRYAPVYNLAKNTMAMALIDGITLSKGSTDVTHRVNRDRKAPAMETTSITVINDTGCDLKTFTLLAQRAVIFTFQLENLGADVKETNQLLGVYLAEEALALRQKIYHH